MKKDSSRVLLPQISQQYIQKYRHQKYQKQNYELIEKQDLDQEIFQPNAPQTYHGVELIKPKGLKIDNELSSCLEELKEEEIDEWIAHSANRPMISYLDPYKKFQAPQSLLQQIKIRWKNKFQDVLGSEERKMLMSELIDIQNKKQSIKKSQSIFKETKQLKEIQKDLTFSHKILKTHKLDQGSPVKEREEQKYKNYLQKIGKIAGEQQKESEQSEEKGLQQKFISEEEKKRVYLQKKYPEMFEPFLDQQNFNGKRFYMASQKEVNYRMNPFNFFDESAILDSCSRGSIRRKQDSFQKSGVQQNQSGVLAKKQKRSKTINPPKIQRDSNELERAVEDLLFYGKEKRSRQNEEVEILDFCYNFYLGEEDGFFDQERLKVGEELYLFLQSLRRIRENNFQEAIDYSRQCLQLNRLNQRAIFNLGLLYIKTSRYELAKKWLIIAFKFNKGNMDVVYAIALASFKLQKPFQSQSYLEQIVENILYSEQQQEQQSFYFMENSVEKYQEHDKFFQKRQEFNKEKVFPFRNILYLYSLSCKITGNLEEAEQCYEKFIQLCTPTNYQILKTLMFTIAFKRLRGYQVSLDPQTYSDSLTLIKQIAAVQQKETSFRESTDKVGYLKQRAFFKRFESADLFQMVQKSKVVVKQKSQVIFIQPETVFVVLSGCAIVYSHQKKYDEPTIINFYYSGEILGFGEIEYNLSTQNYIWVQVQTTELEMMQIEKKVFKSFWNLAYSDKRNSKTLEFLLKQNIFQNISPYSLQKLLHELVEIVQFQFGDVIFSQGDIPKGKIHVQNLTEPNTEKNSTKNKKETHKKQSSSYAFEKISTKGFYIILEGKADLQTYEGLMEFKLSTGDFFGENLLFQTDSITQYGRIKCSTQNCTCLFLDKNKFYQINLPDREILKLNIFKNFKYQDIENKIREFRKEMGIIPK